MMPSMPLVSRPLVMSQIMPHTESRRKSAQMMTSSSQFPLGFNVQASFPRAEHLAAPEFASPSPRSAAELVENHPAEQQRNVSDRGVHQALRANIRSCAVRPQSYLKQNNSQNQRAKKVADSRHSHEGW